MIPVLLLVLLSSPSQQTFFIPSSFVKSSSECVIEFSGQVRKVYPEYQIVTGEGFIAHIDIPSCSILSKQEEGGCGVGCYNAASSVVRLQNSSLLYCYTNSGNAKPMSANLDSHGVYEFLDTGGLPDICLHDADKMSQIGREDSILYIATDSEDPEYYSGYKYYLTDTGTTRDVPTWVPEATDKSAVHKILSLFVRGDYIYTVYQDESGVAKVTRSCKDDSSNKDDVSSFTFARTAFIATIAELEVEFERVLSVEYTAEEDLLYVLVTRNPLSSSPALLFSLSPDSLDNTFNSSLYYDTAENGSYIKVPQNSRIDCSETRDWPVRSECVDRIESRNIVLTSLTTDVHDFGRYRTHTNETVYYLAGGSYLYIYSGTGEYLGQMEVGMDVLSVTVHDSSLYLTTLYSIVVLDAWWCEYASHNPAACLALRDPSCAYSLQQNSCIPDCRDSCVPCNQTFSEAFPDGYEYNVSGKECVNGQHYTDTHYVYQPNSTLPKVTFTYRACDVSPVTSAPVADKGMSRTEVGLLVGLIFFITSTILLLSNLFCSKYPNQVGCKEFLNDNHRPYEKELDEPVDPPKHGIIFKNNSAELRIMEPGDSNSLTPIVRVHTS